MSFGEKKGKNASTGISQSQQFGKKIKLNGRPCTSSGAGGAGLGNSGTSPSTTIGAAFSELHNQRQMLLYHEKEQLNGKANGGKYKNLTEHSIERDGNDENRPRAVGTFNQ